jgi:hypothetical protein
MTDPYPSVDELVELLQETAVESSASSYTRPRNPYEVSSNQGHQETHGVSSLSMARKAVADTISDCFPVVVDETWACLAVAASLLLEDQQNPVALNLEGAPSSQKTTLIDFFTRRRRQGVPLRQVHAEVVRVALRQRETGGVG